jgi:glycosyltransferase involved in cell wall biosynthesis
MKVIHGPFCFRPDPVGGTEVYVEALAREQQRRGVDVVVAAPAAQAWHHVDNGLPVRRFAVSGDQDLGSVYGEGDETASREFAGIVDREQPDVVHLHAFTSAVSARLARGVQQRGVRIVFTYHTPTVSCQRGTLLRWGREVCDGKLDVHTCAGCTLHGLGVGRQTASALGALPTALGRVVGGLELAGGAWTGLRMTNLIQAQQTAFRSFMHDVDRVVVLCRWTADLLMRNSIPAEKLVLSRHGLPQSAPLASEPAFIPASDRTPVRIVFLGRLHPTKGLDILLRAISSLPNAPLELHVYGIYEDPEGAYARTLRQAAAGDPRVRFCAPVPSDQVPTLLRGFDVLAVPSRWLETGPLVVLEAFAAGLPVIGSKLGGLVELVDEGVNGLLVEPESVESWSAVLRQLIEEPDLIAQLRAGIRPPRRMEAVADDMQAVYRDLVRQP